MEIRRLIGCARVYKYFKYLFKKHEELETIRICYDTEWIAGYAHYIKRSAEDEENILLTIFSNLNLRSISLHCMESKGDIFSCLPSTLPILEKLFLVNWRLLSVEGLIKMLNRSRSNLRELYLCYLPGVEEDVNSLPNLEKLTLFSCKNLTNRGLKEILRISRNLRELDLSYSKITGVGIEEGVNSLPNLETLNLNECIYLTDGGLKDFLRLFGCKLKVLDISQTNITGQGFKDEVISLPMLEKLNMGECYNLTDGGLKEILRISGSSIRVLDVSSTNITEQGFKDGVSLPMLERLNLEECDNLTDRGLKEILRISGSSIRVLDVSRTRITGQGFKDGVSLPMLEKLHLRECGQLIDSGLLEILRISGNRLKFVNVAANRMSTAVRSTLSIKYPSVEFIY